MNELASMHSIENTTPASGIYM